MPGKQKRKVFIIACLKILPPPPDQRKRKFVKKLFLKKLSIDHFKDNFVAQVWSTIQLFEVWFGHRWSDAKVTKHSRPKQILAKRFLDALKGRIRKVHSKQFLISLLRAEQNQCLSILIFSLDLWKWSRLQVSRSKMLTYFSYGVMPWTVFQYNVLTCFVDLLKPVQYPLCTVVCPAPDGVLCNWSERSACDQRSN